MTAALFPTASMPTRPALRIDEAATYLGISVASLRRYRATGRGPQGRAAGGNGLLYYSIAELDAWMLGTDTNT